MYAQPIKQKFERAVRQNASMSVGGSNNQSK